MARLLRPTGFKIAMGMSVLVAGAYFLSQSGSAPETTAIGRLEARALDAKFQVRGARKPSGDVVVVGIDEAAVQRYGRWPWSRATMARLIGRLTADGARVIALDMDFTDPQKGGRYAALAEAAKRYRAAGATDPALDAWFQKALADGSPDDQLARAIFASGRVVWGVFGHYQAGEIPPRRNAAAVAEVAPFAVRSLYRVEHTVGGDRPVPDDLSISDPRFEPADMAGIEIPLAPFTAATPFFGLVNVMPDPDGVLRRSDLLVRDHGVLLPSLPLRAVAAWLNSDIYPFRDDLKTHRLGRVELQVGSADAGGLGITDAHGALGWTGRRAQGLPAGPWEAGIRAKWRAWKAARQAAADAAPADADVPPVDPATIPGHRFGTRLEVPLDPWARGRMLVNHLGPRGDFPKVSAAAVLDGHLGPAKLAGRLAVVGVTALGTYDQRVTPFDSFLPGVFVQASIMDDLLTGRLLSRPVYMVPVEVGVLLLLGLMVGLVLPRLRGGLGIAVFLAGGMLAYAAVDQVLFSKWGVDLFLVTPLFTFVLLGLSVAVFQWAVVDREKREVRRAFQHYLAPSVLESVLKDPKKLSLDPSKTKVTVLFSDIRGFTTISEGLPAEELAKVLNAYLTPMTHEVFRHGGTLDKYMGDAIMAFWGDPIPRPDHALEACRTALAMIEALDGLNQRFAGRGWPRIDIGVGVNTSTVSAGNFGSDVLFDYTVMGDGVNLASRLEGINKTYGTHIVISEFTLAAVKDQAVVRELDAVRVKGKREPVRIFELLGVGQVGPEEAALLVDFAAALADYRTQKWDAAAEGFRRCLARRPDDGPSALYLERCATMKADPPGPGWDGVFTLTTK